MVKNCQKFAAAALIFSYQQQLDNGNILKMIKTTTKLGLLHSIFFNNSSVHKLFRGEKITFYYKNYYDIPTGFALFWEFLSVKT